MAIAPLHRVAKLVQIYFFVLCENERLTTLNEFAYITMQSDGHGASDIGSQRSNLNCVLPGMTELQYLKSRNETPDSRCKVGVIRSTRASLASESASIRRAKAELEKQCCVEMQEIERRQQAINHQVELVQIKQEMESKRSEQNVPAKQNVTWASGSESEGSPRRIKRKGVMALVNLTRCSEFSRVNKNH